MLTMNEKERLNKILEERLIKFGRFPKNHVHNFIFSGATRQEICFECFGCHCISYLYYEKEPELFENIIVSCLLDDSYILKSHVDRKYLTKNEVNCKYIKKDVVKDFINNV